ncbi:MAG: TonB-dependent receptor, partial [Calditrichaeota bacterium]
YNPNDKVYLDPFDPFDYIRASLEEREPNARTENTTSFGQLSPRIGVSHPISDKTVLHFNYGHFFQRANFGDYGEGTGGDSPSQRVTGILNTYLFSNEFGPSAPYNLGNRNLKPRKTVQYELGIERNFGGLIVDATAFYKDITNTIRDIRVITLDNGFYITTGNADYADAKGVELAIRKPLTSHWGGYLNYTWSTGIAGTSGDPEVIIPPGSTAQIKYPTDIGDVIVYDPPRLKFGLVFLTPTTWSAVAGLFSNVQISIDYQIYYPHERIPSHVLIAEHKIVRPPDRNADFRLRKEFKWKNLTPAFFVEMRNMFNDQWINLELPFNSESRIEFINSNLSVFPDRHPSGGPFPDIFQYRNLPRTIVLGFSMGF